MYTVSQYGLSSWEGSFIKGMLPLKVLEGGNLSLPSKWTFFTVAQTVKSLPATLETWIQSLGQEDHGRREWQSTPVFLPGKSHGPRGAYRVTVQGFTKSRTRLRNFHLWFFQ